MEYNYNIIDNKIVIYLNCINIITLENNEENKKILELIDSYLKKDETICNTKESILKNIKKLKLYFIGLVMSILGFIPLININNPFAYSCVVLGSMCGCYGYEAITNIKNAKNKIEEESKNKNELVSEIEEFINKAELNKKDLLEKDVVYSNLNNYSLDYIKTLRK